MKVRVLGCSGGIGSDVQTTSFLVDSDILIDSGTGVVRLTVEELAKIDHVFLTHSHLDHIAGLPLMIDSVGSLRKIPVRVYALLETIRALKEHIFNWVIWPDFTEIPHYDYPWMVFEQLSVGEVVDIGGGRSICALPANHTVPAVGYHLYTDQAGWVFSGDTGPNEEFWRIVNGIKNLKYLIVETAFTNREQDLAKLAKHLFPIQLSQELEQLQLMPEIFVTHLKPCDRQELAQEIIAWAGRFSPKILQLGDTFDL